MRFLILPLLLPAAALAQSVSSSATYSLLHAPVGDASAGGRVTGGVVTAEVSTGMPASGLTTNVNANGYQAKGNYIGQLYDPVAVNVSAVPNTVDEGGARQLTAEADLDDGTVLDLPPVALIWGYTPPLVTQIDPNTGIATAGIVFQDTSTQVEATYQDVTGSLDLTILNTDADNFGSYGADGIDDDWQVAYFGEPPNALAAPGENPDGDPHDNAFEFLAGFSPVDATDFLRLSVLGFAAPQALDLRVNRVIPGRTYTLLKAADPRLPFSPAASSFSVGSTETDKPVQDPAATEDKTFYQLHITRP